MENKKKVFDCHGLSLENGIHITFILCGPEDNVELSIYSVVYNNGNKTIKSSIHVNMKNVTGLRMMEKISKYNPEPYHSLRIEYVGADRIDQLEFRSDKSEKIERLHKIYEELRKYYSQRSSL